MTEVRVSWDQPAAAPTWGDPDADPAADIRAAIGQLMRVTGFAPNTVVMPSVTYWRMVHALKPKRRRWARRYERVSHRRRRGVTIRQEARG